LPNVLLDKRLEISADLSDALRDAAVVFVSVPSKVFRDVVQQMRPLLHPDAVIVSTAKGIETGVDHHGFWLMSDVLKQELPTHRIAVLSGPNLAGEIAEKQLTGTVVASTDPDVCQQIQECLRSPYFRVYSNNDVYGVELGGVLKNSYAIACGMAAALGLGYNTISMLITRSLAEMGRFAARLGADPLTFIGLAGVGDLIVTCMSPRSRNYRIGFALGQGKSLQDAIVEVGQVAEGINTIHLVKLKADELGIYMPLVSALNDILFNGRSIADASAALMGSDNNSDVEYRANF
jgi:glycerol-3-phosphate dehydrogenase (NAD(P)+)